MAIRGWPSPLSWDQFEKRDGRPSDHPVDAHIEGAWRNPPGELMRPRRRRDGWRLENIILVVHLVPSETWVVSGAESDALLNHELGHWNILGLVVRELHQTLRRLRAPSPERLGERVEELSARALAKAERLNTRYDDETAHSLDRDAQNEWDALIRRCVRSRRARLPDR